MVGDVGHTSSGNECLVFIDRADGQSRATWNEGSRRFSQGRHFSNIPPCFPDKFDSLWAIESQPERLTASAPSELLDTKSALILCGPDIAGRVEVNGKPTADSAHSPKVLKLAKNDVLAEVHGDAFEDEDRRLRRVESGVQERLRRIFGRQVRSDVDGTGLRSPSNFVLLRDRVVQLEEPDAVARHSPGTTVIAGTDHGNLFDSVMQCGDDLVVEPAHPGCQARKSHRV